MRKLAFYGKGGIGKSTVTCNLSLLFARAGDRVLQIGCDPKADSSYSLVSGDVHTVMEQWLEIGEQELTLSDCLLEGREGVDCIEVGGPTPGAGCGGRGITKAFELIGPAALGGQYDTILFDVLGDVVCGGFSVPMRAGYAEEVYIVTSGEGRALFAANNICWAVRRNARSGARLGGLIGNLRGLEGERELLSGFAAKIGAKVIACIPRDEAIVVAERDRQTVLEHAPDSAASRAFEALFAELGALTDEDTRPPTPLSRQEFDSCLARRFEQ